MPYPEHLVKPMREELTSQGVTELLTASEVEAFVEQPGTALIIVNSVCGCAAGMARPGALQALGGEIRPDRAGTVFAGQDLDATARVRAYMPDVPPSSPSMVLFKDGEPVYYLPRHMIEGRTQEMVAASLIDAFQRHCAVAQA